MNSGVHPTVAGVVLGLLTPARPGLQRRILLDVVIDLDSRLRGQRGASQSASQAVSPRDWLDHALHPWEAFVIMPVFALADAGVTIELPALGRAVAQGVAVALALGRPAGIVLFS